MEKKALEEILNTIPADNKLECDGFTRVAYTLLHSHGIDAKPMVGALRVGTEVIPFHFWLEVGDFVVDYKARMWLGDSEDIPHGVLEKRDVASFYTGESIRMTPLSKAVYNILLA